MNSEEYVVFLKSVLVKIENALNLMDQEPSKHIPAYNKILGVQQKINGLDQEHKNMLFSSIIATRSIINYFTNGRYEDALARILKLKGKLVKTCFDIENEKNSIKK